MVGLSYGAMSLFTTCSVLEIWWLKLQLKSCSEMGVPVLRPPELSSVFATPRCPPVGACIVDRCQNHINLTPWHYKLEMPISATSLNIFPLTIKDAIMKGHLLSCLQALKAMTWGSAWVGSYLPATLSFEPDI